MTIRILFGLLLLIGAPVPQAPTSDAKTATTESAQFWDDPGFSINAGYNHLARKDVFSLSLSGAAFVLSLGAAIVTLLQKRNETQRTLRHQLTDAIGKLNDSVEESAKIYADRSDKLADPNVVNLLALYNGMKLIFARQAVYIASQIPSLVSDGEYNSIARAFLDSGDDTSAVKYYRLAVAAASESIYKATNLRGLGHALLQMGKHDEATSAMSESLRLTGETGDSSLWFRGETFQRWGRAEASMGNQTAAEGHFESARRSYSAIRLITRREVGLRNLDAVMMTVPRTSTPQNKLEDSEIVVNWNSISNVSPGFKS